MKYYKLIYDYDNDNDYINCNVVDLLNMDEYIVSNGVYINKWEAPVFIYNPIEGDTMTDYVANIYRWLIVSDNFIDNIISDKTIKSCIQYLPIRLIDSKNNKEYNSYKVANLLNLVDGLDLEHSKYDVFEMGKEKIISVEKYALRKKEIQESDIFRLKNDTTPIFVSDKIKKMVERKKLSGFAFLEVPIY